MRTNLELTARQMYRRILKRHGLRLFLLFMLFIPCSEAVRAQDPDVIPFSYKFSDGKHFFETNNEVNIWDGVTAKIGVFTSTEHALAVYVQFRENKENGPLYKICQVAAKRPDKTLHVDILVNLGSGFVKVPFNDALLIDNTDQLSAGSKIGFATLVFKCQNANIYSYMDFEENQETFIYFLNTYHLSTIHIDFDGLLLDIPPYDIKFKVDGLYIGFTFAAILNKLREKVGPAEREYYTGVPYDRDKYNENGDNNKDNEKPSSTTSSSTTSVSKGPIHYIDPPKSTRLKYIRDDLDSYKKCRTGCVTEMGAGVTVEGKCGYSYTKDIPEELKSKIKELNRKNSNIVDVNITEKGGYVIIFDSYGYSVRGDYPQSFVDALSEINNKKDAILSACFNDKGQWAIVTKSFCVHSADEVGDFVKKATTKYGKVLHVYLSNEGKVACCARGVYYHYIPSNLAKKLKQLKFKPKVVKFTDNGLFLVTDGISQYDYFM